MKSAIGDFPVMSMDTMFSALSSSSDFSTMLSSFWLAAGALFFAFGALAFAAAGFFAGALRLASEDADDFAREVRVVRLAVSGALLRLNG